MTKPNEELKSDDELILLRYRVDDLMEQNQSLQRDAYVNHLKTAEMNENFVRLCSMIVHMYNTVERKTHKPEIILCTHSMGDS